MQVQEGLERMLLTSQHSGVLNLRGRSLEVVPPEVFSLHADGGVEDDRETVLRRKQAIESVSFDAGGRGDAPNWWEVRDLTQLVVSHNHITELPDRIAGLTGLEQLDMAHNKLRTLPGDALAALPLRSMDVSHNDLTVLPARLPAATLARLACGGNGGIRALPGSIGEEGGSDGCRRIGQLARV